MPATGSSAARRAFERLLARCAVGLRVGAAAGVAAALCLGLGWLTPAAVQPDATSWVFLVASTTVIVAQLSPWPALGGLTTVLVPAAYAGGLALAPAAAPPGAALLLVGQGVLLAALMAGLHRAVRAADLAVTARELAERQAAVPPP